MSEKDVFEVESFMRARRRGGETTEQTLKRLLLACHPDKARGREAEARLVLAVRAAYLRARASAPPPPPREEPAVPRLLLWTASVAFAAVAALDGLASALAEATRGLGERARRSDTPKARWRLSGIRTGA